ncbi:uncharacterized protein SCHCODRAFT_02489941 [Schizophyllum commune H4-8]|uniref:Conidiation-specific protein 6 n=1 Tax=Schizophyllum commune (strain H4-8 / FGSC 9210) TaxID=578458 RepID=D8PP60_SCHCM|nr:uncharacterized protein SCHCODRAFT_02489941 [Schizophyllum commune H4-8]KAI5898465.1 hypothetical protein SCHCODRAFT_02489941 [Schizophyllum commune H4-8]
MSASGESLGWLRRSARSSFFSEGKNSNRVAGGLKATLHNPTIGEDTKQSAAQRLEEMGVDADSKAPSSQPATSGQEHHNQRMGGFKATLHNDNVSEEAKSHARDVLQENNVDFQE